MSVWVIKRTLRNVVPMSALPPIADILGHGAVGPQKFVGRAGAQSPLAKFLQFCKPILEDSTTRKAIEQQVGDLDRKVLKLARYDVQVRRFMTAPGVGPITALCFKATIDRSDALQAIEKCWRLCRIDDPTSYLRRGRLVWPNLEVW